jgi:hypothetical protein
MRHGAVAAAGSGKGTFGVDSPDVIAARLFHAVNITALAACTDLDRKRLYRFATLRDNPSHEHRPLPLELAPVLEIAAGRADLADWHCAQLGGLFIRRPIRPISVQGVLGSLAALSMEFADVQRTSADALHDRRLTAPEARAIIAEVRDLERAAAGFALTLEGELLRKPLARASR